MSWSVIVKRDGDDVVEAPVDDWLAAQILAEVTVALWGGPVSVVGAVIASRPRPPAAEDAPTIFDALEEVA